MEEKKRIRLFSSIPNNSWELLVYLSKRPNVDIKGKELTELLRSLVSNNEFPLSDAVTVLRQWIEVDPKNPKILIRSGRPADASYHLNAEVKIIDKTPKRRIGIPELREETSSVLSKIITEPNSLTVDQALDEIGLTKTGKRFSWMQARSSMFSLSRILYQRVNLGLASDEERAFWKQIVEYVDLPRGTNSYNIRLRLSEKLAEWFRQPKAENLAQDITPRFRKLTREDLVALDESEKAKRGEISSKPDSEIKNEVKLPNGKILTNLSEEVASVIKDLSLSTTYETAVSEDDIKLLAQLKKDFSEGSLTEQEFKESSKNILARANFALESSGFKIVTSEIASGEDVKMIFLIMEIREIIERQKRAERESKPSLEVNLETGEVIFILNSGEKFDGFKIEKGVAWDIFRYICSKPYQDISLKNKELATVPTKYGFVGNRAQEVELKRAFDVLVKKLKVDEKAVLVRVPRGKNVVFQLQVNRIKLLGEEESDDKTANDINSDPTKNADDSPSMIDSLRVAVANGLIIETSGELEAATLRRIVQLNRGAMTNTRQLSLDVFGHFDNRSVKRTIGLIKKLNSSIAQSVTNYQGHPKISFDGFNIGFRD